MSAQQLPLVVCCLPPSLTHLTLINIHPLLNMNTLAAVAAAIKAAGGVSGITAAAQTEAAAAAWRGGAAVDIAAVTAAAEAVLAAVAGLQCDAPAIPQERQEHRPAPFLGLGIACRTSDAAAAGNTGGSSTRKQLLGSREWFTQEAMALLLLDTVFGHSSSSCSTTDVISMKQSLAALCCCCRCAVCCSHASSSSTCSSTCCLRSIFQDLECLTVMAHGPGCEVQGSNGVTAGLHPFLAAGLPHARSLQHIQVSAPGGCSSRGSTLQCQRWQPT